MVILSMFSWWYTSGLLDEFGRVKNMILRVSDQFSIKLLFKTLFQPFRQISADSYSDGALSDRFKAWLDRLFSRAIGAGIRFFVIIVGLIVLFITLLFSLLRLAFWVLLPVLPLVGIYLTLRVGIPWN